MSSPVTVAFRDRLGAGVGVHPAGVGRDADVPLDDLRQDALQQRHHVTRIPHLRVAFLLLLHDGHRDFRQIVHHEIVDGAALDLPDGGLEPVPPEALSRSDADRARHGLKPSA